MAPTTLIQYLKDDKYSKQIESNNIEIARDGETKGRRLLNKGFELGWDMVDELLKKDEKPKALALILKLVPMIKTESDLIRASSAVQIAIDARQQTANLIPEGWISPEDVKKEMDELEARYIAELESFKTRIRDKMCEKCKETMGASK
jgi:hypothetical protein